MSQSITVIPDKVRESIFARAILEGRHCDISQWQTKCDGCGQWVNSIWTITLDKKRLCRACCEPKGVAR